MAEEGNEKDLVEEDDTPKYFKPLMTKDKKQRETFLDALNNSLQFWHSRSLEHDNTAAHLIQTHSATVMRLAITCPFSDVRIKLKDTINTLEVGWTRSILLL